MTAKPKARGPALRARSGRLSGAACDGLTTERPPLAKLTEIYLDALKACSPEELVRRALATESVKLGGCKKLWVFGAGKASASMSQGLKALKKRPAGGLIVSPKGAPGKPLAGLKQMFGEHPDPGKGSRNAANRLAAMAAKCARGDHAVFLLSGGASALLADPAEEVSTAALTKLARALMASGASIDELNTVRKHLSTMKGGQLAPRFECPVTVLVLSDVIGNSFETVGSGPFYRDSTTVEDALEILKFRLGLENIPKKILKSLHETPKQTTKARHVLVGDRCALGEAARFAAEKLASKNVHWDATPVNEEVEDLARAYAEIVRRSTKPVLLIRTGEPVVRLTADRSGKGGRSQHLALLLARDLSGVKGWCFLAAGSDGIDGNGKAAGAVVDGDTWAFAEARGYDPEKAIDRFDTFPLFQRLKTSLLTGYTGNNIQDLHLLWIYRDLGQAEIR